MKKSYWYLLIFLCVFPLSYSVSGGCDGGGGGKGGKGGGKGGESSSSTGGPGGGESGAGPDGGDAQYVSCASSCPNSQCLADCARGTSYSPSQPGAGLDNEVVLVVLPGAKQAIPEQVAAQTPAISEPSAPAAPAVPADPTASAGH